MRVEEQKLLSDFEARIRHLIFLHNQLKNQQAQALDMLKRKDQEIDSLKKENEALLANLQNMKSATTISLDGGDVKETRQKLSKLVREVDKCISMLSQQ